MLKPKRPPPASPATLRTILGQSVLGHLAAGDAAHVLWGQPVPSLTPAARKFPAFEFYGDQFLPSGVPGHAHTHAELALVLDGSLVVGVSKVLYQPRAGDWLVFRSGVLHGECFTRARSPYRLLWLTARGQQFHIHTTGYSRSRGFRVVNAFTFPAFPRTLLNDYAYLARHAWALPDGRARLLRLVSWCLDQLEPDQRPPADRISPLIQEVCQQLKDSLRTPPSVVELANRVGLSPNYLSNLFHQQTGSAIRRYAEGLRIDEACRQLADPARSVKQVAYALGFADLYHFSHVFHRVKGVWPSHWRDGRTTRPAIQTTDR